MGHLPAMPRSRKLRPYVKVLLTLAVGALAGAAVVWAALTVFVSPNDPTTAATFTTVPVSEGAVGSSISVNAAAQWSVKAAGTNQAVGIVTAVLVEPGEEVSQGSVLYRVNQRPILVAQGAVPAYRSISLSSVGEDVTQLQRFLSDAGFYTGGVDGKAEQLTVAAIRSWQESLGIEQTGVVELSDIVFVPNLPARVVLDGETIDRGTQVIGGEQVVNVLAPYPDVTLPISESQAGLIPTGAKVEIKALDGAVWTANVGAAKRDEQSQSVVLQLVPPDGAQGAICASSCGSVPPLGQTLLSASVITVAETRGLVVPSAALVTDPAGAVIVVDAEGLAMTVEVIASARGMSIVTGVPAGTRVRVPASEVP